MTYENTNLDKGGVSGLIAYINDRNHINHREKDKGEIQVLESVKTLDKTLLKDGSSHNKGISMILPIPTFMDSIDRQKEYTNEFIGYFCKQIGIDKNAFAYECVIHNHIDKDGKKNYHAHIVFVDREINKDKSLSVGRKRYYKIVNGKKVRCSKKESDGFTFSNDKSKTFLNHFKIQKEFNCNGKNYFVRDFSSIYMPMVATTIEKNFINEYDNLYKNLIAIERRKHTLPNITDYSYLKVGKKIDILKMKKPYSMKSVMKYYNQQFRINYNKILKTYNTELHSIKKRIKNNEIEYKDEDAFFHNALGKFKSSIVKEIENMNKNITELNKRGYTLQPFKFNFYKHRKRSVYNKTLKPKEHAKKKISTFEKNVLQ